MISTSTFLEKTDQEAGLKTVSISFIEWSAGLRAIKAFVTNAVSNAVMLMAVKKYLEMQNEGRISRCNRRNSTPLML